MSSTIKINCGVFLLALVLLTALFFIPITTSAQRLVYECAGPGNCVFQDVITAITRIMNTLTTLALSFSVVVLVVAGFKYMTSGGNASKRQEANKMFTKVIIGIVVVVAAWLIVRLITSTLLDPSVVQFGPSN